MQTELNEEVETPSIREELGAAYDTEAAKPNADLPPSTAPSSAPAPAAAPSPAPAAAATTAVAATTDLAEAKQAIEEERPIPQRLKDKWGEKWKTIDKELRAEFHGYESHIGSLASKYGKAAQAWEKTQQVFAPYAEMTRQEGGDFHTATSNLFETARILRQGLPEQKINLVRQMCQAYGIPLASVIGQQFTTADTSQEAGQTYTAAPGTDPALIQRLNTLERDVLTREATESHNLTQRVNSDLESFLSDPTNVYTQQPGYLDTMTALIRAGKAVDLKSAYDQAKWLHAETRELEIAKSIQNQLAPRINAARTSRAAGVSVNGNAPGSVHLDPSKMDLRATLMAASNGDLN